MNTRRSFLKKLAAATSLSGGLSNQTYAQPFKPLFDVNEGGGPVILFQGDSITDGNRTRNNDWNHIMGHGYAYLAASRLWYDYPTNGFQFINRGVSGNRVTDLMARWQADTLDLKPSWLSILVGVNDTEAAIKGNTACTPGQFEADYRLLLKQTREQLPDIRFVLCEPFILPVGRVKDKLEIYQNEVRPRQEIVRRLATEFDAVHVPFQAAFNEALTKAPAEYWIWDGIHPMPAGHELMARLWIEKVGKSLI